MSKNNSKPKENSVKFKMHFRRRVCKVCQSLRRSLLRTTICKLVWILCAVISFSVLAIYILKAEYTSKEYEINQNDSELYELKFKKKKSELKFQKNPAIVWWNVGFRLDDETIECPNSIKCNAFTALYKLPRNTAGAYLFYGSRLEFDNLPLPKEPQVLWALSHEESPKNVAELLHESALNLFNISSTFSRYSDVPFPLQALESVGDVTSKLHFVPTLEKNNLLEELAPIIYMNSNCYTLTDRDEYVKELMKYIPVDSYGACLNNKKWPEDFPSDYLNSLNDHKILNFIARYKFAIAIENGVCEDYVTEKLWRPIKLGVVPIYYGSPSVKDWLPNNKSAILTEDFPSPKVLSEHLYKLLGDDNLYEEYLEHKTKGLISNKRIFNELETRPYQTDIMKTNREFECLVCKRLHENIVKPTDHIVNKSHYDCPIPVSALTGKPTDMVFWEYSKNAAEDLLQKVSSKS